jgi:Ca2+/Na+ antiporter
MLALFKIIRTARKITLDILIVAISNYFIVAIVAGSLCYLSYLAEPETAFRLPQDIKPIDVRDFIYFAFVTLATLGYGDISPSNQETMTLSALIAVTGQFYVAVLVAFLVSKLGAEDKNKQQDQN